MLLAFYFALKYTVSVLICDLVVFRVYVEFARGSLDAKHKVPNALYLALKLKSNTKPMTINLMGDFQALREIERLSSRPLVNQSG